MPSINRTRVKKYKGVYQVSSKIKRHRGKSDKCYYITYKNNGKLVWEKVGWASEGYSALLASGVRNERVRTIRHGKELPEKKKMPTFGDVWKKYDKWLDTGKKHVYDDRNRFKNHIKPKFENKFLSGITTHDLEKFKAQLLNKGLAPATVKHVLVIIRQVFYKAVKWGLWTGENPIKGVEMPKINNQRIRFLTSEEADILLSEVEKASRQVWEISIISLHTGMRASEVFALRFCDIDFDNDIINVADTKGSAEHRTVFMTKKARQILLSKGKKNNPELGFEARGGGRIKEVSKTILRTVNKVGFNEGVTDRSQRVSFHTLRHTFASWLAIQGTPILEIKELLGHKTLAMTERYAHLIPDQKRNSVARMEKTFIEHQPNPMS